MNIIIDSKHPDFERICEHYSIEHTSRVHHFELSVDRIVMWSDIDIATRSSEK